MLDTHTVKKPQYRIKRYRGKPGKIASKVGAIARTVTRQLEKQKITLPNIDNNIDWNSQLSQIIIDRIGKPFKNNKICDFRSLINKYFEKISSEEKVPTISELSLLLGLSDREFMEISAGRMGPPRLQGLLREARQAIQTPVEARLMAEKPDKWLSRYGDRELEPEQNSPQTGSIHAQNVYIAQGKGIKPPRKPAPPLLDS